LPGWAKLIIAGGVLIMLIHPKLRAKVTGLLAVCPQAIERASARTWGNFASANVKTNISLQNQKGFAMHSGLSLI
jgi:hypothetical protein